MLSVAKHLLLVENNRAGFLALLGMTSLADYFTASERRKTGGQRPPLQRRTSLTYDVMSSFS